jgi:hypothetical protein
MCPSGWRQEGFREPWILNLFISNIYRYTHITYIHTYITLQYITLHYIHTTMYIYILWICRIHSTSSSWNLLPTYRGRTWGHGMWALPAATAFNCTVRPCHNAAATSYFSPIEDRSQLVAAFSDLMHRSIVSIWFWNWPIWAVLLWNIF